MHLVTFSRLPRSEAPVPESRAPWSTLVDPRLGFDALEVSRPGTRRLGALLPASPRAGDVVDLNRALAVKLAGEDAGAPEAEADSRLPADALAFLRNLDVALPTAHEVVAWVERALADYDPPDLVHAGILEPRRAVRLCAPVPRPGKIVAVARNYADHARERGDADAAPEPVLFLKAPSSVIGPEDEIRLPAGATRVDYEGELAAVIGRTARGVRESDALDHVAGYTVANDVTDREGQERVGFFAKSADSFCPLGPALVTADEIPDPQDLAIGTRLSGVALQQGRTKEMRHSLAALVACASARLTLEPGDVLLTGTPAGVGAAQDPPRFLRDGDVVEVEIEGIGRLHNYVREQRGPE